MRTDLLGALAARWQFPWLKGRFREGVFAAALMRERDARRPFLFLPVGMIGGVLLYFAADREPSLWAPMLLAIAAGGVAGFAYRRELIGLALVGLGVGCLAVGFAAAAVKARLVQAPVLEKAQAVKGRGVILQIDRRGEGARLLLGVEMMAGRDANTMPQRVRVTSRGPLRLEAGQRIEFSAFLLPPPQPSRPGGYDFARDAWFAGIGAVGTLQGKPVLARDQIVDPVSWRLLAAIDRARNDVTARIAAAIGGQAGEVAAALITGKRGGITEETNDVLRAAGIYHVVSISGLHMVLAAGMVFFIVRALFALSPAALLVLPVKSIAAVAAILAAIAYDIFAGSEIATERSLIMTVIVFGAVLAQRRAISMRNLALAAMCLIVLEPETVVGPSFQMSFCAVMGLVALYEKVGFATAMQEAGPFAQPELPVRQKPPEGVVWRVVQWAGQHGKALILTTLIAEATTAPFALYHFQQVQPLGLLGNALVLPLISVVVMPAALLGMIALPFGLDAPIWFAMGEGVRLMLLLSGWVAALPLSVIALPAPSAFAVTLGVIGLLIMALCVSGLRYAGLPVIALGIALAWVGPRPDLYVAGDGKAAALRMRDGRLALIGGSPGRFSLEQWLRADGDPRKPDDPSLKGSGLCDRAGCVLADSEGSPVSLIKQASAFEEDCGRATLIITGLKAPAQCAAIVLDAARFAQHGAAIGYRTGAGGWRFEGVRTQSTDRYWRPQRPQ